MGDMSYRNPVQRHRHKMVEGIFDRIESRLGVATPSPADPVSKSASTPASASISTEPLISPSAEKISAAEAPIAGNVLGFADGTPVVDVQASGWVRGGMPHGYEIVKSDDKKTTGGADVDIPDEPATADPRALYWDPFALVEQLGYREKPTAVTYGTLAAMVWKVPIIQAIIQTRIHQVSSFCVPQHHKFETGFRIKLRDIEARPTPADKKFAKKLEQMLMTTGACTDPRSRDSFETFVRKITRDSLTYDQMAFEVVPDRKGRPCEWYAVDAATMRLADTNRLYPTDDPDRTHTVQIYDNIIIGEFTRAEMAFEVRNPRTDIRTQGYGVSELEMLVSTITSILWAWNYNQNFFSQGSVAKGLLNIVGDMPEKQLRAFRRQWYQMISGVENAWRTPIVNAQKLEWINMLQSNRDMEFSAWMDFLIKVACAIFSMDPIEVNFKYGQQGGQKAMFEGANKSKLVESKDRGLKPLLRFIARSLDKYIIWPINPDFTLEFVGLEAQTPKEMADLFTQRVRTMYTINELRAENDLEPLDDGLGDVILDANWMNAKKEVDARKEQEKQQKLTEKQNQEQAKLLAGTDAQPGDIAAIASMLQAQSSAPGGPAMPGAPPGKPAAGGTTPPSGRLGGPRQPGVPAPAAPPPAQGAAPKPAAIGKSFEKSELSEIIEIDL